MLDNPTDREAGLELLRAATIIRKALEDEYSDAFIVSACFTALGITIFNAPADERPALMKLARETYAGVEKTAKRLGL